MIPSYTRCLPRVAVVIALALLLGCPPPMPRDVQFTSADPGGVNRDVGFEAPPDAVDDGADADGGGEREVVEPDVIRHDGDLLYVLNQFRGLSILDLETETLLAQVPTLGYPRDLYLVDDRAYVIVSNAGEVAETDDGYLAFDFDSRLYVVDVADAAQARIIGSFPFTGDLVDSRLVGDVLYAISADYQWGYGGGVAVADAPVKQQTSASWVTSINVANPANIYEADTLSFGGYGDTIQATNFALFVADHDWQTDATTVTYVDISDPAGAIAVRSAVTIPGRVADRFKMDAWNGALRVISNTGWQDRQTYVTTVSLADPDNLAVLGQTTIPGAEGETLFATRFDGPRAYVVTFLIIDPLFVLDLADPANPIVAGELHIPGWSTHLEPRGDKLVALGVDDTGGNRRVSVSLFDVSVPSMPALLARESFGDDWSWSSAYNDVKALTVTNDTIIVPFSGWTPDGGFDRLQFLSWTPGSLSVKSTVDVQGGILRSFQRGETFYGVTSEQVAVIEGATPDDLAVTHTMALAENVIDYVKVGPGVRAEVVNLVEDGRVRVRTEDTSGNTLGVTEVALRNVSKVFVVANSVLLVTTVYEEDTQKYRVAKVDCADPANLDARLLDVDVPPYWDYGYWYGPPWGGPVDVAFAERTIAPDIWWPGPTTGDTVFLTGDTLVLRCRETRFDSVLGEEEALQGFATVNVSDFTWTATAGLGYRDITAIDADGVQLYVGTKEGVPDDVLGRAQAAHYLRIIDPVALTAGPAANVPGEFLSHDMASQRLITRDMQYRLSGEVESSLRSLQWDGGATATLIDTFVLDRSYGNVEIDDSFLVVETYTEGLGLQGVRLTPAGLLEGAGNIGVTQQWGYLEALHEGQAYVVVGGRAVARYALADDAPQLLDVTPVMNAPLTVRFFDGAAYAPLGYAGLAELPTLSGR